MTGYDSIYRRLFSHPEMVLDLLRHFVGGDWVERLDPTRFTRVPAHYVAEELEHREQDLVWRVRTEDERDLYVYILLEFQSSVDRLMALRLWVYLGLLYQDLARRGDLTPSGQLPPVLPLVLYNGEDRWWAATELSGLIDDSVEELRSYQPRFRYEVIDEVHLPRKLLDSLESPVAGIFEVERSRSPAQLRTSLRHLLDAFERAGLTKLKPEVETWLRRVVRPKRFRDLDLTSWAELKEVTTMLEERVKQWEKELLAEGRQEGRQEGRAEGLQEGQLAGLRRIFRKQFRLKFRRDLERAEEARLESATMQDVETLLERILTADSPSDLFSA